MTANSLASAGSSNAAADDEIIAPNHVERLTIKNPLSGWRGKNLSFLIIVECGRTQLPGGRLQLIFDCIIELFPSTLPAMNESVTQLKDTTGNPAPLGLLGFGMTTVLLNLHNAGFYDLNSMILAMGICYGGLAQIIAGIMEWRKGNTFAMTAFVSYGLFWLSLVALIVLTM